MDGQFAMLQLRDGEQAVDEGEEMLRLVFHDGEVFLLDVGLPLQYSAMQVSGSHDDGGKGRFHVVYHGVGKVLAKEFHSLLLIDVVDLVDDAKHDDHGGEDGREERNLALLKGDEKGFDSDIWRQGPNVIVAHLVYGHLECVEHPKQQHE